MYVAFQCVSLNLTFFQNPDGDFMEDETMYDDLNLDEEEEKYGIAAEDDSDEGSYADEEYGKKPKKPKKKKTPKPKGVSSAKRAPSPFSNPPRSLITHSRPSTTSSPPRLRFRLRLRFPFQEKEKTPCPR